MKEQEETEETIAGKTIGQIKKDFPTLINADVSYLDSGASSQTPLQVLDAMTEYYSRYRSSVHRGVYEIAMKATALTHTHTIWVRVNEGYAFV